MSITATTPSRMDRYTDNPTLHQTGTYYVQAAQYAHDDSLNYLAKKALPDVEDHLAEFYATTVDEPWHNMIADELTMAAHDAETLRTLANVTNHAEVRRTLDGIGGYLTTAARIADRAGVAL
ncbi:hypothetical protein [Galactobacter sp.]|uniref:hypothetical protein n=1 Tax=Galactobacter sp. TaxID=2676125 RepID=UPI0025C06DE9|nr:hypothetical protein [Galactobacter sp.]